VETKTEPSQEERNRSRGEGPPKLPLTANPRQQYSTGREREKAKLSASTESRRPHSV